ncbi:MAG TPA: hypothetical protein PKM36_14220, partial [Propionibacteriaceae bacterium]|nr:hypothetical protein [Propionibacteriaceae bacterium]
MTASGAWPAIVEAAKDVVDATFLKPVREGSPRPKDWQPGLVATAVATAVLYVLLVVLAATAGWLREVDTLLVSYVSGITLPSVSVPLLLGGLVWSMILVHTAALHIVWWARLALGLTGVIAVGLFGSQAWNEPLVVGISVALYVALWTFILIRSRRSYAWWELPVVGVWMVVLLYLPWLRPGYGSIFGIDHRLPAIQGTLAALSVLSAPALLAAGVAPAIIAVTAGESVASRQFPRWLGVTLVLGLIAWRGWSIGQGAVDGVVDLALPNLVAAAVTLALMMLLARVLLLRSTRATLPGPGALPEIWASYAWPLAMAIGWVVLLSTPIAIVRVVSGATGIGASVVEPAWRWFGMYGPQLTRLLVAVIALVLAWRLAARQQVAGAVLLASFFIVAVVQRAGSLSGVQSLGLVTPDAAAAVSTAAAVVLLMFHALMRGLTRRRVVGLATVLVLGAVYPLRNALDDPMSALLGFSGLAVLLFGLGWQLLTNADHTYSDSTAFPRSTRVLLYLVNALFALTGAAYLALSREPSVVSATDWSDLGDDMLGTPLFIAAVVTSLWWGLDRREPAPVEEPAAT